MNIRINWKFWEWFRRIDCSVCESNDISSSVYCKGHSNGGCIYYYLCLSCGYEWRSLNEKKY